MKLIYRTILGCVVISLFTALSYGQTKPNVVILLADDQGWGDLSWTGNTNISTPNIDKIGVDGASFENFYVQAVCSPTRAELLTGRYASRSGVYSTSAGGERIDLDEITMGDIFKKAGYVTGIFGKWHSGMQYPYHPNARGFDEFYGFCSGHWGNYFDPLLEHNGEIVKGEGFLADDLTNHAISFVEKNRDKPFLLYLPFNTPHSPMQVPDAFWNKFENKDLILRANDGDYEDETFTKAALAMCENIDWNVGRLMDKLRALNLEVNTIVIYFTDNGPNGFRWNGGMKGKKGGTDEGSVRSPLLIKWPQKIKKGFEISEIAGAIDLLPTLTDLASINTTPAKELDGISLKKLLFNQESEVENRILFNYWHGRFSARNQRFRLDTENKLYDMNVDRAQKKDLSLQFPEVKNELLNAKEVYFKTVVSELPKIDKRTFPLGHINEKITQIPARDGVGHGNIKRSNKYPNCSFYTNWISVDDSITWDVEVLETGDFEVILYYTCNVGDEGATIELSMGENAIQATIDEPFESPLTGMENDKIVRIESYVKEFKPLNIGTIHLDKGQGQLQLKALDKKGEFIIDVRLLLFKRKV